MIIRWRKVHPALLVAVVLVVLAYAAGLVSETVSHTSVDPTDQAFTVTVRNDTSATVVVKQCDSTCETFHETDRISPGADVAVNTSSDGIADWWAVTDTSGSLLGCLPLSYTQTTNRLVIDVFTYIGCST